MTAGGRRADRRHIRPIWWPPPPPLHCRSVLPHAAAAAAGSGARTQLGVFENTLPPQLLLITVIIVIIRGLSRPVWGPGARPDNEAARGRRHSQRRRHQHAAFIRRRHYWERALHQPPRRPVSRCLKTSILSTDSRVHGCRRRRKSRNG